MVLVLGLLIIGALARFLPHAPNFSPVVAIALFGGVYLRRSQALWLPLALMAVTDLVIGLHATVPFTWGSVVLASFIGLWVREKASPVRVAAGALLSAALFFVITNFGSWLAFYPQTAAGLRDCYILAIPFFRTMLISTAIYSIVLFGAYEFLAVRFKNTRLAFALLNK
jgi:hypothetical protein